jgi:Zn-dependent protease
MQNLLNTLYLAIGIVLALGVHEYAEAFTANRLGDPSAKRMGWMRFNLRAMVDTFGTIVLPAILLLPVLFGRALFLPFAYARPMPLNSWNFKKPDRDAILVSLSGPIANVAWAFVLGVLFRIGPTGQLGTFLRACLLTTIVIGVLNLIPIPPLDGSRVVGRFLQGRAREVYSNLQQYGALFMLLIFFIFPGPINAFVTAVGGGICDLVAGSGACPG